jgi:hypothetical protein
VVEVSNFEFLATFDKNPKSMKSLLWVLLLPFFTSFHKTSAPPPEAACYDINAIRMNVVYIGVKNDIFIQPVLDTNLVVTLDDNGELTKVNNLGHYDLTVNQVGKATIRINRKDKDYLVPRHSKEFLVKRIPSPYAKIGNNKGGVVPVNKFKEQKGMILVLEDFDFEVKFNNLGYEMIYVSKTGKSKTLISKGPAFTKEMKDVISAASAGDIFSFINIKAKGPDEKVRDIPAIVYHLQ